MAQSVTIEGSITPSTLLARGQRKTVAMTPRIQRLIDRGFVVVVERHGETDAPEQSAVPAEIPADPSEQAPEADEHEDDEPHPAVKG